MMVEAEHMRFKEGKDFLLRVQQNNFYLPKTQENPFYEKVFLIFYIYVIYKHILSFVLHIFIKESGRRHPSLTTH